MEREQFFTKIRTMGDCQKVAMIVMLFDKIDEIADEKDNKERGEKAEALKSACEHIINLCYEVSKED